MNTAADAPLTIDSAFDLLGGNAEVGRIIGKTTEHAGAIRRRGRFPVEYWPTVLQALQTKGVSATEADLVRIYNAAGGRQEQPEAAS